VNFAAVRAAAEAQIQQVSMGPHNRPEAVKIIPGLREIVSPQGLQASSSCEP